MMFGKILPFCFKLNFWGVSLILSYLLSFIFSLNVLYLLLSAYEIESLMSN